MKTTYKGLVHLPVPGTKEAVAACGAQGIPRLYDAWATAAKFQAETWTKRCLPCPECQKKARDVDCSDRGFISEWPGA